MDCFIINRELLLNILGWYEAINHLDIFDVLQTDFYKMDVRGYQFDGPASSIFTVSDYFQHSLELLKHEISWKLFDPKNPILTKHHDMVPTKYVDGAVVKDSILTSGCIIEGTVENSIIFSGCTVEAGAVVKNSIILQHCTIKAGACIENAIVDRGNVIAGGSVLKGTVGQPLVIDKAEY